MKVGLLEYILIINSYNVSTFLEILNVYYHKSPDEWIFVVS